MNYEKGNEGQNKRFALDVWLLCAKLHHSREFNSYVNQLLRCSSSVAANYRAVNRAKSKADFINKLKIVEEEADESQFFLEIIHEIQKDQKLEIEIKRLIKEADEILAIIVSSIKTTRGI
ncbi:four helix bundle protein [Algoriphagus ornithinivorans]|uniref:Four helix bundle protein n=1 Tax=Algoriphagus ornithinivorans TaxID=226506 RepID=A0A1I5HT49_9BACT|nr:four helix bundle protein [Algoriphagus ornithinivorans]SFO51170.1 four helix bundle protein [Algoriphagus ornithinivorans]